MLTSPGQELSTYIKTDVDITLLPIRPNLQAIPSWPSEVDPTVKVREKIVLILDTIHHTGDNTARAQLHMYILQYTSCLLAVQDWLLIMFISTVPVMIMQEWMFVIDIVEAPVLELSQMYEISRTAAPHFIYTYDYNHRGELYRRVKIPTC